MQLITRKGSFDSAHRVMNEKFKCFNLHGHTYLYEIKFDFNDMEDIGYAIDFKEIKRVHQQWIDDLLDHGTICNPMDTILIETAKKLGSKLWLMSLNGEGKYCNPSVENIAKEVFLACKILSETNPLIEMYSVEIHETPNCSTTCFKSSISGIEEDYFYTANYNSIKEYAKNKGVLNYDDRK